MFWQLCEILLHTSKKIYFSFYTCEDLEEINFGGNLAT